MNKGKSALIAVIGGLLIFGLKLFAYFLSGSIALLSDALESIANILASFMMLMSVRVSSKPADGTHPYGHQKVEHISCFVEGALVIIAALAIAWAAIQRIFSPVELGSLDFALIISLTATAMNGGLSWILTRSAKETGSLALEGDAKHLLSDVLSSVGVVVGLILAKFTGWTFMDPLLAIFVATLVFKMGIDLLMKSGGGLMDQACPIEEARIRDVLNRHRPQFIDFHDVKTRRSGERVFAELHLSVDPELRIQEAHDLTDHLEEELKLELPGIDLTIHVEPPRARGH